MWKYRSLIATIAGVALILAAVPGIASAHERRTVGKYTFVVGFINEPAIAQQPNGIDLTVTDSATNQPVEGVEKSLKAQIIYGGSTEDVSLRPRFGLTGKYTADVIPTKTGTWKFHFSGTINNDTIDELFTSGPGRFNDVQAREALEFPVKQPVLLNVSDQASAAQSAADSAKSTARTSMIVGVVGVVVGLVGLAVAGIALQQARRTNGKAPAGVPERRLT